MGTKYSSIRIRLLFSLIGLLIFMLGQPFAYSGAIDEVVRSFLPARLGGVRGEWHELKPSEFPKFYTGFSQTFKDSQITKALFNDRYNVGVLVGFESPMKIESGSGFCLSHATATFYLVDEKKTSEFILTGDTTKLVSLDPEKLSKGCAIINESDFDDYVLVHEYVVKEFLVEILTNQGGYLKVCEPSVKKESSLNARLRRIWGAEYSEDNDYVLFYKSNQGNLKINLRWQDGKLVSQDCSELFD